MLGTGGTVLVEGTSPFDLSLVRVSLLDEEGERQLHFPTPANRLRGACEHLVRAIRGDIELELHVADGLRSLEVCTAMVESARAGA